MSEAVLLSADHDGVRVLTLNRPHKLNALDTALTTALHDALVAADSDDGVRAVVLTGAGRAFCAGADLGEFANLVPEHQHRVLERARLTSRTQMLLSQIRPPVVAAVQGAAMGGGAGLALGADMTVVADDLRLGYPEVKHGIVPALVLTGLRRVVGPKIAFELVSTGRSVGADEAVALGIANAKASVEGVVEHAVEVATRWASMDALALRTVKDLFHRIEDLPYPAAMRAGQDVNALMRGFSAARR